MLGSADGPFNDGHVTNTSAHPTTMGRVLAYRAEYTR